MDFFSRKLTFSLNDKPGQPDMLIRPLAEMPTSFGLYPNLDLDYIYSKNKQEHPSLESNCELSVSNCAYRYFELRKAE